MPLYNPATASATDATTSAKGVLKLAGDLAGTATSPTLAAIVTGATVGSATAIPVITYDSKGRVTSTTTVAPTGGGGGGGTSPMLIVEIDSINFTTTGTHTSSAISTGGLRFFPVESYIETTAVTGYVGAQDDGFGGTIPVFNYYINFGSLEIDASITDDRLGVVNGIFELSIYAAPDYSSFKSVPDGSTLSFDVTTASTSTTMSGRFVLLGFLA